VRQPSGAFESGAEAPHSTRFAEFVPATSIAAASGVRRFTAAFERNLHRLL